MLQVAILLHVQGLLEKIANKFNCLLCRMTFVLLNNYELKISMQKSYDFEKKNEIDTAIFTLHD